MLDLSDITLIDNHCHLPLHAPPPRTAAELASFFSEATDPLTLATQTPHSLFFRRAVRDLANLLGMDGDREEPPDVASVLTRRAEYSPEAWFRLIVERANIAVLLADTGYPRGAIWTVEEARATLAELTRPAQVYPILRLERIMEDLLPTVANFAQFEEAFRVTIRQARNAGAVALKSIIAYRSGLDVMLKTTAYEAKTDGFGMYQMQAKNNGAVFRITANKVLRITAKKLLDYFLGVALEEAARIGLPVQFHCGFGDPDVDLLKANPALLRPIFEDKRLRGAPIVLLHCYPYMQEASYLASIYPHVYVDLSLASPHVAYGGGRIIEDALGLAPATKVMYGGDATGIPDVTYLAALHTRRNLTHVLERWISEGWLGQREARAIAQYVLADNARQVYAI